jgi:hypothetical protein
MMKRTLIGFATVALTLALVVAPARAQLNGYPVYAWTSGPGITLAGDFGRGLNDASGRQNAFGGRIGVTLPMVSVWAGAATVDLRVDGLSNETTFGGGLALKVFDPPLIPLAISLQAGAGYMNQSLDPLGIGTDISVVNVPLGVAFALNVPNPAVEIQPWIAPRIHFLHASALGGSNSEVGFGTSAGLNVTLPAGFGAHLAADYMSIGDPSVQPLVFGAGFHYRIPLPGVPGVPGM